VDVYVRYLREKVDRPFGRADIQTVRGVGYRLRIDEVDEADGADGAEGAGDGDGRAEADAPAAVGSRPNDAGAAGAGGA